ncbi:lymphocyte antigen 96 isoform 1-T3 [Molossus nigricans]|uniref:Lymphocyte antigen 96 n=1 Tax=Molossus molossus TaxID=27622 RepID=A0A7J8DTT8_MOLMO|nr:lymphocyte antigen 96 [Molossus molossus]XP_036119715.1 lymphocyte antigen 96 [Molossus molossus]XP_036119716.1 lymphocyte antigen 96 [Molossus molossus]KAF6426541.1 lymphocyte antigen 96 [Molossus molossus]
MFPLMLFSTLFSSTFTEPREQHLVCNSSDVSISFTYCGNMKYPISIKTEPCIQPKGSKGYLYISYIPRRDMKKLYFNLYITLNTHNLPMRKEVLCRGSDDDYSFCRTLKGETMDIKVSFSFKGMLIPKGQHRCVVEAFTGDPEKMLFCLNFTIIHHPNFN